MGRGGGGGGGHIIPIQQILTFSGYFVNHLKT